jgi:hypothetical protein
MGISEINRRQILAVGHKEETEMSTADKDNEGN